MASSVSDSALCFVVPFVAVSAAPANCFAQVVASSAAPANVSPTPRTAFVASSRKFDGCSYRGFRKMNYLDTLSVSYGRSQGGLGNMFQQTGSSFQKQSCSASLTESSSASVKAPTSRLTVIAGNWKMNKTITEAVEFVEALKSLAPANKSQSGVYLGVPFTAIYAVAQAAKGTPFVVGAQNMSDKASGAFTGEVSGDMIKDAGAKFVILGHSERRTLYGETSETVNSKVKKALADGIQPIVCIGESLDERESGRTENVLESQITKSFADLKGDQMRSLIIAYEPIWAIGTGRTATPEVAQETHRFIRSVLGKLWGPAVANLITIQYGGSVTPENVKNLMSQADIDGALVGGASLKADSFQKLVDFDL